MLPKLLTSPAPPRTAAAAALLLGSLLLLAPVSSARAADAANTQAVVNAASAFLAPLSATQTSPIDASNSAQLNTSALYNFTLTNVEVWSNLPVSTSFSGSTRNGLIFSSLSSTNQANALAVASAALSTAGRQLLDDVRAGDRYISGEVTNARGTTSSMWGYNKYFIAFVGTPSTTSAFTFQFGGHHLAYNITYNGTFPSGTPIFAGTEPNAWTDATGTYAPLGTQRSLLESLRSQLSTAALLSGTFSDVVFGPNGSGPGSTSGHDTTQPKAYPTSGRGQLYSALTSDQQALVRSYIQSWVNLLHPSLAAELLPIYLSDLALAETYVGYAGSNALLRAANNYFRVDGPRLWIEFSVQGGVYDPSGYHDHGIVRDKLADYGAAYGTTTIATTLRPPVINTQPASQSVATGGSATFAVSAASAGTGNATLSYQWYKDGVAISGATGASYTVASAAAGDAGSYSVAVVSTGGLTTSAVATLTVGTGTARPAFFSGEAALGNNIYYLAFPNGNVFGYYSTAYYPYLYHFDAGFSYFVDGGNASAYLYDFTSGSWWYTGAALWPYVYDFSLNSWLYYFPDATDATRYTRSPRYFYNFTTRSVITR